MTTNAVKNKAQAIINKTREFLFNRQYYYRQTFETPYGDKVLADLAKFCRAHETTFRPDARESALLEGRKEVFLRIAHHLNMTQEQLWQHYTRD